MKLNHKNRIQYRLSLHMMGHVVGGYNHRFCANLFVWVDDKILIGYLTEVLYNVGHTARACFLALRQAQ